MNRRKVKAADPAPYGEDFERICKFAWAIGSRNGLLNDIRGWDERRGTEEYAGSTWTTFSPAVDDARKAKFRELVLAVLTANEGGAKLSEGEAR